MSNVRPPPRLNLTYLRRQGRELLRAVGSGDQEALSRVDEHLPAPRRSSLKQGRATFGLRDALLVLARENGFPSWPKLKEQVSHNREGDEMQYITFMHANTDRETTKGEWDTFFDLAQASGLFRGGSAMGKRWTIGKEDAPVLTDHIGGYMRFDSESVDDLLELLEKHPTVLRGGSIEICEMPKT